MEVARRWFDLEFQRRPQFKQVIQDLEHRGRIEFRGSMERTIREAVAASGLSVDPEEVIRDLFSTMRAPLEGYRRMISNSGSLDRGHWAPDPQMARELWLGRRLREHNPAAEVRVVSYDVPLTHYGHVERPKQLAGALLASVKWLYPN